MPGAGVPASRESSSDGLLVVDKPAGMTSHDVVARLRRICGTRKVGHAGTLDPMATGVLVVGVNRGTRLLHHLVLTDKAYLATIRLGASTITDDAEGEQLTATSAADVDESAVRDALPAFTGAIEQIPSSVSAIKVDGKRSYARVRAGEDVALAPRPVTVHRFDVLGSRRPQPDLLDIDVVVECTSGTYIRALARDLGAALGVGGHLSALRRTRVGPFVLEDAHPLDELGAAANSGGPPILALPDAIATALAVRAVDAAQSRELGFGRSIAAAGMAGTYGVLAPDGSAVALVREADDRAQPVLVFTPAG